MAVSPLLNVWKVRVLVESLALSSSTHLLLEARILALDSVDIGLEIVHMVLFPVESIAHFSPGHR